MYKLLIFIVVVFIAACNNESATDSPYNDLLTRPPYEQITDSIRDNPDDDALYFRRAVLLNQNNQPEPALVDFKKAWQLNPTEKYAFGVTNALLEKRPDSALVFMNQALSKFPKSLLLQFTKARVLTAMNKPEEALKVCDSILAISSEQPEVYLLKAQLHEQKGDLNSSAIALEKAYSLVPDLATAYKLAFFYAENKNPKTLAFSDSLIKADTLKMFAEPIFVKGIYYSNTGDKKKAIDAFDETIKRDYNFLDAYIEKGRIQLEQKRIKEALQTFELANTIKPSFPDAWYWIGKCQEALGHIEDAKLSYQKAYSLDKSFVAAKDAEEKL